MTVKNQRDEALTIAFREVFGANGRERTKAQLLVLARLRHIAKSGEPLFRAYEDDRTLAMREGRAEMWIEIDRRCEINPPSTIGELFDAFGIDNTGEKDDEH